MFKGGLLALLLLLTSLVPGVASAAVRQDLGAYDTLAYQLPSGECLRCHSAGAAVSPQHHLRTLSGTACSTCHVPAVGGTTAGGTGGECATCHAGAIHHTQAVTGCTQCHGSAVNDPSDGHYIPAGPFDSTTPSIIGANPGQCGYCHQQDDAAAVAVVGMAAAHHGFTGGEPLPCGVCHGFSADIIGIGTIRDCQSCHGIDTLHNIQADTDADGVVSVLAESAGRGHVGDAADCRGCHVSDMTLPQGLGNIVPFINAVDSGVVRTGVPTKLTIFGTGFRSRDVAGIPGPAPIVVVSGVQSVRLEPVFAGNDLQVTVPALPAGSYTVAVEKGGKVSNALPLYVVPAAVISSVHVIGDVLTVSGAGFGVADPLLVGEGTVSVDGVLCSVISWSETLIQAALVTPAAAGSVVRVTTLFDTAATTMNVQPKPEITAAEWVKGTVTVRGTNFGPAAATNSVSIGSIPCTIVSWGDTEVIATTVADPSDNAVLTLTCGGGTASAPVAVRRITITSAEWLKGTVTVTGTGFGAADSIANAIIVNGAVCVVTSWSDNAITARLTDAPATGATVTVSGEYGSATAALNVKVVKIASVAWGKGVLTITGSGFGKAGYTANAVYVDLKPHRIISWSDTKITVEMKLAPPQTAIVTVEAEYGRASAIYVRRKKE